MRNRNSETLDQLLGKARGGSTSLEGLCLNFLAGICPRNALFGTRFSLGKCHLKHELVDTAGLRGGAAVLPRARASLRQEVCRILARTERKAPDQRPEVVAYLKLREEHVIQSINSHNDLVEIAMLKMRQLERVYERKKVPNRKCSVCPGTLPWPQPKQEEHLVSRVHLAYARMREAQNPHQKNNFNAR
ncbi:hypothetical protein NEDG_01328 [Nematocida displodere]|uniref:Uncharacterized protein n=1 Tax=Nematocida displodere TaxID=1805483 RepID=A0A177EBE0_9MICR|nr:hypothetical protein NEDG_01328 [Nematocida displodere]